MALAIGIKGTEINQGAYAASDKWTSLNSEVVVSDVANTNQVTFADTVDSGWQDICYTGALYSEQLDLRDYVYEVTINTTELTSNGSLYLTVSNNLQAPWDSYNWSVGALIIKLDYWGKFNWESDYGGAVQISAANSVGATIAGDPVSAHFNEGAIKLTFDIKPNGTIVRVNDSVSFTTDGITTRNVFDYWSNYKASLSIGPQGTRMSTTSYTIAVEKVSRVANVRVDGTGKTLSSLPNGGVRMVDQEAVGWYGGALYQGVVYDDLVDTTQEIEVNVQCSVTGSFYVILNNSLTIPYSNVYYWPAFVGIGIQNYGSWERVVPLNSTAGDPATSNYYDSALFNTNSGLTVKFVIGATTTDIFLNGTWACQLNKGGDLFSWYGNKAQISFGGYESRTQGATFDIRVNNSASDIYAVEHFVRTYLHEEVAVDDAGTGKCTSENWFANAKAAYNALTQAQRDVFAGSNYATYYNRLYAWAQANDSVLTSTAISTNQVVSIKENKNIAIIMCATLISVAALTLMAFALLKKKRFAK